MKIRLQKVLADAGVASRRACDKLIDEGLVKVNNEVATISGLRVDPEKDKITYKGKPLKPVKKFYVMVNKPTGYVCTNSDEKGRRKTIDLIKDIPARLYTVGRLDWDVEGLIILTNDGDFAYKLTHPKHHVPKTYVVKVKGAIESKQVAKIFSGIYIDGRKTQPAKAEILKTSRQISHVRLTLFEGKKREIKRMFFQLGYRVYHIKRISIDGLKLRNLQSGRYRNLRDYEIKRLMRL
ncbi:rRNA pseudouridine synthase [bacterium]|nr:rRNA pseudouridine synthase [bacterium]